MNKFDRSCLDITVVEARRSFDIGNYPAGAVLAFDHQMVARGNNIGESSKNYVYHAEAKLIIENGSTLLDAAKNGKFITLYCSLEPCLMCLGAAVLNKVNRIVYIQSDPHAGACSIDWKSLGVRYHQSLPKVVWARDYSPMPKRLIRTFLMNQIKNGVRVEWSKNFLALIEQAA